VYWAVFFAGTVVVLAGTCQFLGPARQEVLRKKKPTKGKKSFPSVVRLAHSNCQTKELLQQRST